MVTTPQKKHIEVTSLIFWFLLFLCIRHISWNMNHSFFQYNIRACILYSNIHHMYINFFISLNLLTHGRSTSFVQDWISSSQESFPSNWVPFGCAATNIERRQKTSSDDKNTFVFLLCMLKRNCNQGFQTNFDLQCIIVFSSKNPFIDYRSKKIYMTTIWIINKSELRRTSVLAGQL